MRDRLFSALMSLKLYVTIIGVYIYSIHADVEREGRDFELYHELNSIALGVALALLVLICFFSYIFQAFNFYYLPEPSVCLICGMLVGFAIRYNAFKIPYQEHIMSCDVKLVNDSFPEKLVIHNKNETHEYSYEGKHSKGHKTKKDILSSKILFDPEIFFHLILPPIIFNIGFKLQKRYFFRNFGTILTISLAGTALTLFLFGILIFLYSLMNKYIKEIGFNFAQSIMFGVIICSTDPVSVLAVFARLGVDVDLYSIILGESALNDAVSLIAQRTVNDYLHRFSAKNLNYGLSNIFKSLSLFFWTMIGSVVLGTSIALFNAVLTKILNLRKYHIIETAIFFILSYSAFLLTEICGMVGIVGILFCAIFQAHYTRVNLSEEGIHFIKNVFELICFFLENFVFAYMGITVFVFGEHNWNIGFIIWSFVSLMISRAATIYFLCYCLNFRRRRKITKAFQHILFFSGLKGALAFALALEDISTPVRQVMLTTTIVLVLITVLLFGGLIGKLAALLKIPLHRDGSIPIDFEDEDIAIDHLYSDESFLTMKFRQIDENFLSPFFTIIGPSYKLIFTRILNKILFCFSLTKEPCSEPIMKADSKSTLRRLSSGSTELMIDSPNQIQTESNQIDYSVLFKDAL